MDKTEQMAELETLGKKFAERYNRMAEAFERGLYWGDASLPALKDLDDLDEFGRSLTTKPVFKQAPAPDRANLAEVRCIVSDAVLYARALDYDSARDSIEEALRKLMRVRDRKRTKALPSEVEDALLDAAAMLVDVIAMFEGAENAMVTSDASRPAG